MFYSKVFKTSENFIREGTNYLFIYVDYIFRKLISSSGLKHKILKTVKTVEIYYNSVHTSTHLHSLRQISELKKKFFLRKRNPNHKISRRSSNKIIFLMIMLFSCTHPLY